MGGGNAAGRRVLVPVGEANVDWRYLTGNGRLVVQRAIAWAMNADNVSIGKLLMVVVDDNNLTSQEDAKQALLESWGYVVTVIDQDDNQPDFDAALVGQDVVFITEDVASGSLGSKLVDATIGVVTEEDNLSDEFGLSDSIHWGSGTTLTIDDNLHFITSPFSLGPLTVLNTNHSLSDVTGTLAPDLQMLGSTTAGPALVAIDAGATIVGGGSAAGRRVQLPWGSNDMQLSYLAPEGLTIFQRALEWGAGAPTSLPGPVAHWKLDEPSGTIADDSAGPNDGTLLNGPTWAPGILDGGLEFDGSDDRVDAVPSTSTAPVSR